MAGRMIEDEFRKKAFGNDRNFFEDELRRGHTINSVTFERGGTDDDDDYIVFGMDFDWSAAALKKPKASEA